MIPVRVTPDKRMRETYMSENNSVVSNDNSDLDAVIKEVKREFKMMLGKRKDLIIKLGEAIERNVSNSESVCEEIKNELREEIAQGLVSTRIIELHCPDKWKKKTKPKKVEKNENISFSRQEQEAIPQLLVDTHGNTVVEPASDSNNNDAVHSDGSAKEEPKYTEEFRGGDVLEDVTRNFANIDQQLLSESGIKELKTTNERLKLDLKSKSDENLRLQSQIEDLKSRAHNDQEDKFLDIQFEVPFEPLREHMASALRKHIKSIWFFAKVDLVTKSISNVQLG